MLKIIFFYEFMGFCGGSFVKIWVGVKKGNLGIFRGKWFRF